MELARRRARDLSRQLGRLATAPTDGLRAGAVALRAGIERRLDEQLNLALDRLGIPSAESIAELESEIARVVDRIQKLEKRTRARRGSARTNAARGS